MSPASAPAQLRGFIGKFTPLHQRLIRALRRTLRARFPTAHELVYDNYNFFVIGYCTTERASDCIVSLVAGAGGVSVCFTHGARLPDPKNRLEGSGTQTRFLRIASADILAQPEVEALIAAAVARAKTPLASSGSSRLIIRSISAKQRPRRAGTTTGSAARRA